MNEDLELAERILNRKMTIKIEKRNFTFEFSIFILIKFLIKNLNEGFKVSGGGKFDKELDELRERFVSNNAEYNRTIEIMIRDYKSLN